MAVTWCFMIAIGVCGGSTVGRLFSHSANLQFPNGSRDRSFRDSSENVVRRIDTRDSPGNGTAPPTVPDFTPGKLTSSTATNVPTSSSSGPSSFLQSTTAGDPFVLPQPPTNAVTASTPASNNNPAPTSASRSPCSGNSGKVCNPTGGPGLTRQPNIVVFLCDDLGRADISYVEGNLQTPTPNVDKLAWDGIILNRHYVNPICTPTRAAFMTGKYTFRIGMQTAAISDGEPWGLPLQFKVQPQYFKDLGYDTWAVGKWHLGSYNRASLPNSRGIDESYMIMLGHANWFNYTAGWITPVPTEGKSLLQNNKMVYSNLTNNQFLPDLFTTTAEKWIQNANPNNPFWLYFATPAPHTGYEPYGAVLHTMPQYQLRPAVYSYNDKFPMRKKLLGTIQVIDESFKRIIDALTYKGVINNTIVVFFSDNGGALPSTYRFVRGSNWSSNWPLRHGKGTLFEGGVRVVSFLWSPLLPKRGRITDALFHASDWLPTLYEAAGGDVNQLGDHPGDLDGMSHWKSFYNGLSYGPRTELVLNIDTLGRAYSMIYQDGYGGLYKLLSGNVLDNSFLGWFRTPGTNETDPQTVWTPTKVECNFPAGVEVSKCDPHIADCLFDLTYDPCETNNIAASYPAMLRLLQDKIKTYNQSSIPSQLQPFDPAANPDLWGGLWVPWKDPVEILDKVPLTFMPFTSSDSY